MRILLNGENDEEFCSKSNLEECLCYLDKVSNIWPYDLIDIEVQAGPADDVSNYLVSSMLPIPITQSYVYQVIGKPYLFI